MSQADPIKKTDAARYVKVIVPVRLDRVLTYSVPESLSGKVGIGSRVKVRLGPRLTDAVVCLTDVMICQISSQQTSINCHVPF